LPTVHNTLAMVEDLDNRINKEITPLLLSCDE
jgi:hypothetical protein